MKPIATRLPNPRLQRTALRAALTVEALQRGWFAQHQRLIEALIPVLKAAADNHLATFKTYVPPVPVK